MIREMKQEALGALKGNWGLGVGGTMLYFVLSYVLSLIAVFVVMIPGVFLLIGMGFLGAFEEEALTAGAVIIFMIFYAVLAIASLATYGVTMYGYTNMCVQLSRGKNTTVDSLFEGFRGFKKMIKAMKTMVLIFIYTGVWVLFLLLGVLLIFAGESSSSSDGFLSFILLALLLISFIVMIIMYFSYAMTYYVMVDHPEYSALEAMKESKALMKGHKQNLFMLWLSFIGWGILAIMTFGIGLLWLYPYVMTTTAVFYNKISNHNETKHEH